MKTKGENDMIDHIGAINIENDTKLSWFIGPNVVCDKNYKEEQHDRLYKCGLHQNWN